MNINGKEIDVEKLIEECNGDTMLFASKLRDASGIDEPASLSLAARLHGVEEGSEESQKIKERLEIIREEEKPANRVGHMIKLFAIILLVVGIIITAFTFFSETYVSGEDTANIVDEAGNLIEEDVSGNGSSIALGVIYYLLTTTAIFAFFYGLGEIIELLQSVKDNTKNK